MTGRLCAYEPGHGQDLVTCMALLLTTVLEAETPTYTSYAVVSQLTVVFTPSSAHQTAL